MRIPVSDIPRGESFDTTEAWSSGYTRDNAIPPLHRPHRVRKANLTPCDLEPRRSGQCEVSEIFFPFVRWKVGQNNGGSFEVLKARWRSEHWTTNSEGYLRAVLKLFYLKKKGWKKKEIWKKVQGCNLHKLFFFTLDVKVRFIRTNAIDQFFIRVWK